MPPFRKQKTIVSSRCARKGKPTNKEPKKPKGAFGCSRGSLIHTHYAK